MFKVSVYDRKERLVLEESCSSRVCKVGKARDNHIRLNGWRVAPFHLEIEKSDVGLFVDDVSLGFKLNVNGKLIKRHGPLVPTDLIEIAGYKIRVSTQEADSSKTDSEHGRSEGVEPGQTGVTVFPGKVEVADETNEYMRWSKFIHGELFRVMDLRRMNLDELEYEQVRSQLGDVANEIIDSVHDRIPESVDLERLKKVVLDEAVGLGPLEDFLTDPQITEIMVNRHNDIYLERNGKLTKSDVIFSSDEAVLAVIDRIISPIGRRIDESSPMVDARLRDGSRVNAIIPPLALKGPCITIRKFSDKKLSYKDLVAYGSASDDMMQFLKVCVEQRMNIVVSGGTGSGKTTLLNILSDFIPADERVVTVEDSAELKLSQPHVVTLEARPANMEGKGAISIRELVKNCLRMRPDRIVVGECRGGEALDMLQAMNTGHDGSLTTAHANSPRDMLRRLEVMVLMAGMDLPVSAIREQVSSAVNLVVQQTRFVDGARKITSVSEVTGIESGNIQLNEIFRFRQTGFDSQKRVLGSFEPTGRVPEFYEDLRERGVDVDMSIFVPRGD